MSDSSETDYAVINKEKLSHDLHALLSNIIALMGNETQRAAGMKMMVPSRDREEAKKEHKNPGYDRVRSRAAVLNRLYSRLDSLEKNNQLTPEHIAFANSIFETIKADISTQRNEVYPNDRGFTYYDSDKYSYRIACEVLGIPKYSGKIGDNRGNWPHVVNGLLSVGSIESLAGDNKSWLGGVDVTLDPANAGGGNMDIGSKKYALHFNFLTTPSENFSPMAEATQAGEKISSLKSADDIDEINLENRNLNHIQYIVAKILGRNYLGSEPIETQKKYAHELIQLETALDQVMKAVKEPIRGHYPILTRVEYFDTVLNARWVRLQYESLRSKKQHFSKVFHLSPDQAVR